MFKFFLCALCFLISFSYQAQAQDKNVDELWNMSLSDLKNVKIEGITLTNTSRRKTPSTVTTISQQDIQFSGARSLNELLEVMVPNLQMIFHPAKARHLGLRGVNGTRDDKYLLVVDGRVMNEHTDVGVMSERDLPLFNDIYQIDIIRGPGSALYGPGALAMVINVTTETGNTFQGTQINQRVGSFEEFYSSEIKYGHIFNDGAELMIYGGIAVYPGADANNSPIYYGATTDKNGNTYLAGEKVNQDIKKYNAAYGDRPKAKLQLHYKKGKMESGFRYTQGGEYIDLGRADEIDTLFGQGYRHGTVYWQYQQEVADNFSLSYDLHYDRVEVISGPESAGRFNNYREDKYFGKVIGNFHPAENQELALGVAWSHEEYGLAPTSSDQPVKMYRMAGTMPRWSADMISILGEHQWNMNAEWTTFVSARLDKHTFTDNMFSPRATVIFTPNEKNTFKVMASRAVRTNTGADMKNEALKGRDTSEVEILEAIEFRYEHEYNDHLWLETSVFMHSQDLIGWGRTLTNGDGQPMLLGHVDSWGLELEATYRKDSLQIDWSHSYTKMLDFNMTAGVQSVEESAAPMGYGDDFANWFNHMSKIRASYQITPDLLINSALVVYWYNPGGEDYALWRREAHESSYDINEVSGFEPSYLLNIGVEYRYSDKLDLRLDSYNILGWLNEDFNTIRYGYNNSKPGMYRVRPEAIALQLVYRF